MVPFSKSVSGCATLSPQIRFCAILPRAKTTFVSGSATLCHWVLEIGAAKGSGWFFGLPEWLQQGAEADVGL
jgi:hypothetical protein